MSQKFSVGQPEGWAQTVRASTTSMFGSASNKNIFTQDFGVMTYPPSTSNAITNAQSSMEGLNQISKSFQSQINKQLTFQSQKFNFAQGIGQGQNIGIGQSINQAVKQLTNQATLQSTIQSTVTDVPTIPMIPIIPTLLPPIIGNMFNSGGFSMPSRRSYFKTSRKNRYTPSLGGILLGLKAYKPPRGYSTGAMFRPMLTSRRSKPKRRSKR